MHTSILDRAAMRPISAEEYMRAKLDYEMTPTALNMSMGRGSEKLLVIDVRDKASYEKEHIPGAVNVPEHDIRHRAAGLPKEKTLVTYSWDMTCTLAPEATMKLAGLGFKVHLLAGGLEEWKRRDLPLEKKASARRGAAARD
ncbi:MAG: hypothetical protein A2V88_10735 [Elusimicrobia bacterium RBG_16_66_12]|nr:MAG: hypothetical protein A2V88_10735 [Elusimicrobia bacterium RBG_16_66_12]